MAEETETPLTGEENIVTSSTSHGEPVAAPEPTEEAKAAEAKPEGDKPEPEETEEQKAVKAEKGKERLNARFSELTSQRNAETARAEAAEAELARLRQAAPARTETRPDSTSPPDPSQYEMGEFDPKFIADRIDYGVRAAMAEQGQRFAQQAAEQQYTSRVEDVRGKLMDSGLPGAALLASGDPSIRCTPVMIDVLSTLEKAPQVADHLANNPGEAARIASLAPHLQGAELVRIEARMAAPAPKVSNAPEATRTLVGLAPAADEFSPDMSQAEFEKQIERKHGGFLRN